MMFKFSVNSKKIEINLRFNDLSRASFTTNRKLKWIANINSTAANKSK
jgi:hypothetical protein